MKNVLLVFGGKSYEHDISVVTASQIYCKTRVQNLNLILFYISREGEYFIYDSKKFVLEDFSKRKFSEKNRKFKRVAFVSGENNIVFIKTMFGLKQYLKVDCAIFACHGGDGENGKLVSVFESVNISCSSGSVEALGICMNKFLFKQTMRGIRVPTVKGFKVSVSDFESNKDKVILKIKKLGFPLIIKPNTGGSSIGIFTVEDESKLEENLTGAFEFDSEVVVEKFIGYAREFNVAVIGDSSKFEVSKVDEPLKSHEVLSFADKYLSSENVKGVKTPPQKGNSMASQARKFPAEIDDKLKTKLQSYASKIFSGLGLSGIVRIDFLFDENEGKVYVCEVNAIPGSLGFYFFSEKSLLVNNVTLRLIEIAEQCAKSRKKFNEEFSTSILSKD